MKYFFLAAATLLFAACNDSNSPKVAATVNAPKAVSAEPYNPKVVAGIEGYYTGPFKSEDENYLKSTRITIRIDSLVGTAIYGWSMVAGNGRNFVGTAQRSGNGWTFTAREPGNDPHDGTFEGSFGDSTLTGNWTAFDSKAKVPVRSFELVRRPLRYDPTLMLDWGAQEDFLSATYDNKSDKGEMLSEAVFQLNASAHLLKPAQVENLYKADLEVLRNTIYARHGYSFRNARMRSAFDHSVDWYMPVSTDVTAQLTSIERQNIALLKRYEGHAVKYYDTFGR